MSSVPLSAFHGSRILRISSLHVDTIGRPREAFDTLSIDSPSVDLVTDGILLEHAEWMNITKSEAESEGSCGPDNETGVVFASDFENQLACYSPSHSSDLPGLTPKLRLQIRIAALCGATGCAILVFAILLRSFGGIDPSAKPWIKGAVVLILVELGICCVYLFVWMFRRLSK